MKKALILRAAAAAATLATAGAALASGDSGTGGVSEAPVTGKMFAGLLLGVAGLGVVLWLMSKFFSRQKKP